MTPEENGGENLEENFGTSSIFRRGRFLSFHSKK
jgi:hypothetical protein